MHLIGIVLFAAFIFYFFKATLETLWGGCLLIQIVFLYTLSGLLYLAAALVGLFERPAKNKSSRPDSKVTANRQAPIAGAIRF